jgi:uncharacterized protein
MDDCQKPVFAPALQPDGVKYRFHAMVKPVGATCNLDCTYCFYLHKKKLLKQVRGTSISDDLLEEHIRQYIEAQTADEVVFSWQGGEPTLLGIDFFRRAVQLQEKHCRPGLIIGNDLQTNGTLLTEEWVVFLKEHGFLVGLSVDGPAPLHDIYRSTHNGEPTHAKVMAGAKLLQKHSVPFNALCVVNRVNAKKPLDVYRFLTRELGVWRVQFSPCVEPRNFEKAPPNLWNTSILPVIGSEESRPGHPQSVAMEWSVDPEEWGTFLCKVWDEWYRRDYGKVHVDLFETAIAQSLGLPAQRCVSAQFCGKGLAVEHNGDVFACDHYVYPLYHLGNIREDHLGEMAFSERQKSFGFNKRNSLPGFCQKCEHLNLCWGECPKNRLLRTPDGEGGLNYLCLGQKKFFTHIQRDMPNILKQVRAAGW